MDHSNMQDIYQLGIADMLMNPMDLNGFWYLAKAINIATAQNNAQAAQNIATYGKGQYRRYHGSEDGWEQFVAAATNQTAPPAPLGITPKTTNFDIAARAVAKNKLEDLSFNDWEVMQTRSAYVPQGKTTPDKDVRARTGE